jgi:hypothetical protein
MWLLLKPGSLRSPDGPARGIPEREFELFLTLTMGEAKVYPMSTRKMRSAMVSDSLDGSRVV